MEKEYDVAIIGGGPAGSTVGTLLRRYNPELEVVIFEREFFPREHVGESQLPILAQFLFEMGVWDKVEAAGFPIKIGATYRWGRTKDLWDLDFLNEDFIAAPRPARFEGQRQRTAFQVDRSVYDKILLDHAKELGCKVFEGRKVSRAVLEGNRIVRLETTSGKANSDGETWLCRAKHYVDGSGEAGVLRRALGVQTDSPTSLRNIAIWDYWDDAQWAISVGVGGTLVQIMSIGWGWIWFIPISETRASVGLVMPAARYKESRKGLEETYLQAIAEEPLISKLLGDASRRGPVRATKDWSFIAEKIVGENWFLVGDACGFADPILSAGMTLAQGGARRAAYAILELERGELEPEWLRANYEQLHRAAIRHHIRFADFWYSANGCFTDLKQYCSQIAKTAGLELGADDAFRWLSTGGFAVERLGEARASTFRLTEIKAITNHFLMDGATWQIGKNNVFRLNLEHASEEAAGRMQNGRIEQVKCYRRGEKLLPLSGHYWIVFQILQHCQEAGQIELALRKYIQSHAELYPNRERGVAFALETLEAMIADGWVVASRDESRPFWNLPQFANAKSRVAARMEAGT